MKKTIKVLVCILAIVMSLSVVVNATTLESLLKQMDPSTMNAQIKTESKNTVRGEVIVDGTTSTNDKTTSSVVNPFEGPDTGYFEGDKYIFEDNVKLEESVNGNVYIFAQNVEIGKDVVVLGNAFIGGNSVTIEANVSGTIYLLGENAVVNGECQDLYAFATNFTLGENAYVERDVKVAGTNIAIKGSINRDLVSAATNTTIGGGLFTKVARNIAYSGTLDASDDIKDKAVSFKTDFNMEEQEAELTAIGEKITNTFVTLGKIVSISTSILLALIFAFIFKNRNDENENYFASIMIGMLYVIITPLVAILIMLTIVGLPIGLLLLFLYILALLISVPAAIVVIAQKAFKEPTVIKVVLLAAVLIAVFNGVLLVPFLGGLIEFLLHSYGFYKIVSIFKAPKKEKVEVVTGTIVE
mgnify:CR=1 FL=1